MANRTTVFTENPPTRVPRSSLNLDNEILFDAEFQKLYPVFTKGCIPGDIFRLGQVAVIRFMPLVAPIMSGVKMRTYSFFCAIPIGLGSMGGFHYKRPARYFNTFYSDLAANWRSSWR